MNLRIRILGGVAVVPAVVRAAVTNVVLMIGDGMGTGHIAAASWYAHGRPGALFMESLPHRGEVVTHSAYLVPPGADPAAVKPRVTDSAAAGTAMATGRKVFNGVLSLALPGDGSRLETVVETFRKGGRKSALVSTAHLTDATPAAFAAHMTNRGEVVEIARQILTETMPDVLLGGAEKHPKALLRPEAARTTGYLVVTSRAELAAAVASPPPRLLGLFSDGGPMAYEWDAAEGRTRDYEWRPHLSEMATAALDILAATSQGFFAMIEGACIDKAAHKNHLEQVVGETLEFDRAVQAVVRWAQQRGDTLVIVTADHETGGLAIVEGQPAGRMPKVSWTSKGHTADRVPIFAVGPGAERVAGVLDNTDIHRLILGTFTGPTRYEPAHGVEPVDIAEMD